jgi:hypothetical protein
MDHHRWVRRQTRLTNAWATQRSRTDESMCDGVCAWARRFDPRTHRMPSDAVVGPQGWQSSWWSWPWYDSGSVLYSRPRYMIIDFVIACGFLLIHTNRMGLVRRPHSIHFLRLPFVSRLLRLFDLGVNICLDVIEIFDKE